MPDLSPRLRASILDVLRQQQIETPSWAYGNSGTRFKVFAQPGVPRTAYEKIDDAATVNRFTGIAPRVALHIPWDRVEDYADLKQHAEAQGVQIGAINPNLFQEDAYKLGSVCNPDPAIRRRAIDHLLECIAVMEATGSTTLSLWFADGTNYPGQDDVRARQERLAVALRETYDQLPGDGRLLLEYKMFEPHFYSMDVPDWGTSLLHCLELGPRAQVLVDTGHHGPNTNIEFIVANLLRVGRLGGFHFNSAFYADDDLMVGAADPYRLFRIMYEIVSADALKAEAGVAFMLDQCHNLEPKVAAEIRSVMNVQEATAKALLVDNKQLGEAQARGDVLAANAIVEDAFKTDVRPMLAELREDMGIDPDPVAAYRRSGHLERVTADRAEGQASGWGA
jgi:L-rhamnose isomerase / sugar isomerase